MRETAEYIFVSYLILIPVEMILFSSIGRIRFPRQMKFSFSKLQEAFSSLHSCVLFVTRAVAPLFPFRACSSAIILDSSVLSSERCAVTRNSLTLARNLIFREFLEAAVLNSNKSNQKSVHSEEYACMRVFVFAETND